MGKAGFFLVVAFLGIQLVPVSLDNPPETGRVDAPPAVAAVLEQSCFDCHSHQTRWPWYARIAPFSWGVAWDVHEAREHLNFSTWDQLDAEDRAHAIHEVWEEVEEGEMPLWYYLPFHPEARLDEADLAALRGWAQASGEASDDADSHAREGH